MSAASMVDRAEIRIPKFFGKGGELYGCFHTSDAASTKVGAVLCYPFGQEYIRSHRSFLQLARGLVRQGIPTLRFDYYATGDSAGSSDEGRMERWIDDIGSAVEALRGHTGVREVILVGLRLGGSLALLATHRVEGVEALVLWDPVVRGEAFLRELTSAHQELIRFGNVAAPRAEKLSSEAIGFPLPEALLSDFRALDLTSAEPPRARRMLIIESGEDTHLRELRDQFVSTLPVEHKHVQEAKIWLTQPHHAIVPNRLLTAMLTWVGETS